MMTLRKPTTDELTIARYGTPRGLTLSIRAGASCSAASANSTRDALYNPELRHDSTAVSTTAFIT